MTSEKNIEFFSNFGFSGYLRKHSQFCKHQIPQLSPNLTNPVYLTVFEIPMMRLEFEQPCTLQLL